MKKYKPLIKVLSLVMVLMIVMTLIGVCQEKVKLTLWMETYFVEGANELLTATAKEWAEKKGVDIDVVFANSSQMSEMWAAALEANKMPDIGDINGGFMTRLYYQNRIAKISDLYKSLGKDPNPFTDYQCKFEDGEYYGIPLYIENEVMFYRKDLLAAAGYNEPPKTWDELLEMSKKIMDPKKNIYGLALCLSRVSDANDQLHPILWSYGASVVAKDGKTITINSPETIEFLKFVQELYKTIPPAAVSWDETGDNKSFQMKQTAFAMNWGSIPNWIKANDPELFKNVGFMVVPRGPRAQTGRASGVYWSIFNNDDQKIAVAKDFIKYWFDNGESKWLEIMGGYSVPGWDEYKKGDIWNREDVKVFAENSKFCHAVGYPGPETAEARDVNAQNILVNMVLRVIVDKWTPEEAAAEAEQLVKEIYSKMSQ